MKTAERMTLLAVMVFGPMTFLAFAQGPPTNPNGFPSGDHYNLNIIGKKPGFVCPPQEYDAGGNPIYGNVVFVPQQGEGDIWLNSGSGRKATGFTTLQVTDPCVTAIDGTAAQVQIPALPDGYWVYARALGKLTDNPSMTISPDLITVSSGEETLVYVGYVTSGGFYSALEGATVTRVKGKHPAIPINRLFEWSGDVCYDVDPSVTFGFTGYTYMPKCLADTNSDGILDTIVGDPVEGICSAGTITNLYCHHYDTSWVFNIADFVNYLWDVDNSDTKLVQIRFYPR